MIRDVLTGRSRSWWVLDMRSRWVAVAVVALGVAPGNTMLGAELAATELSVVTGVAELRGPSARQQLLAAGRLGGVAVALTRQVEWRSETPGLVAVGKDGVARALGDGEARIVAVAGGQTAKL